MGEDLVCSKEVVSKRSFDMGWVARDVAQGQGVKGKSKFKSKMGVPSTGVNLECGKNEGSKEGIWIRFNCRTNMKDVKTDSGSYPGTKRKSSAKHGLGANTIIIEISL